MNLNFFSGDALLRTAPLADDADADGPAGENRPAQPEVTYRELLPKLLKSPLPLVLLVGVRYLIEFSVPIALYLGWAVVYNNLNHDFAAHLVFRSTENVWCITREFLRSKCHLDAVLCAR